MNRDAELIDWYRSRRATFTIMEPDALKRAKLAYRINTGNIPRLGIAAEAHASAEVGGVVVERT